MRVKQFDDIIETNPDFVTIRNHISKTVTGDGKKVMLMGCVWRLIRQAAQLGSKDPLSPEPVNDPDGWLDRTPPPPDPVVAAPAVTSEAEDKAEE